MPVSARSSVLHFVVGSVYPCPGGMQDSALRIAAGLAVAGFEVFLYTHKQPAEHRGPAPEHEPLTVLHLNERSELLLEPFGPDEPTYDAERTRVDALLLRDRIESALARRPEARHLVVSFYASTSGFLAQHVASRLGLPHLASFRGTDYSRDIHGTARGPCVAFVVDRARLLVTTNREQADGLRTLFGARQPIHTIHNAIDGADRALWTPRRGDRVRLLSDSGFSGRKATQVLLRAVGRLVDRGLPVSLELVGGAVWPGEAAYWERVRQECETRYPGVFDFGGRVPRERMDERLRAADLYCSSTLAEGCSLSRLRALTLGVPIVTTRCGALAEVAGGDPGVLLAPPGDWEALAARLEEAVELIRAGRLAPDRKRVEAWRRHFSPERERAEWRAAVDEALEAEADPSKTQTGRLL